MFERLRTIIRRRARSLDRPPLPVRHARGCDGDAGECQACADALGFVAWAVSQPGILRLGSAFNAGPAADALQQWARDRAR